MPFIKPSPFEKKTAAPKKSEAEMVGEFMGEKAQREFERKFGKPKQAEAEAREAFSLDHAERRELLEKAQRYLERSNELFSQAGRGAHEQNNSFEYVRIGGNLSRIGKDPHEALEKAEELATSGTPDTFDAIYQDIAEEWVLQGEYAQARRVAGKMSATSPLMREENQVVYYEKAMEALIRAEAEAGLIADAMDDFTEAREHSLRSSYEMHALPIAIALAREGKPFFSERMSDNFFVEAVAAVFRAKQMTAPREEVEEGLTKVLEEAREMTHGRFARLVFFARELVTQGVSWKDGDWKRVITEAEASKMEAEYYNYELEELSRIWLLGGDFSEAAQRLLKISNNAGKRCLGLLGLALKAGKFKEDADAMISAAERSVELTGDHIDRSIMYSKIGEVLCMLGKDNDGMFQKAEKEAMLGKEEFRPFAFADMAGSYAVAAKALKRRII